MNTSRNWYRLVWLGSLIVLVSGCVGYKKLRYMTDLSSGDTTSYAVSDSVYTYRLKPGDVLYIKVQSSTDSEMELFNQSYRENASGTNILQANLLNGVLIDQYGDIELPMIGKMRLSGLTMKQAEQEVSNSLLEYLNYVTVSVKLMSFRISVLGEVASPGIKQIDRGSVTLLEALAYGGDLTEVANRKKVRLIRRENNKNRVYTIDLSTVQMLDSEFFFLRPDDVLYVEPLRYKVFKVNSPAITLGFSLFSVTVALFAIFSR